MHRLGIDLGGTKIEAAVLDGDGVEIFRTRIDTAQELGYASILDRLTGLYEQMVERMYEHGKAVNTASLYELDDVIDPADSRRWISRALASAPKPAPRTGKKRPCIDTW